MRKKPNEAVVVAVDRQPSGGDTLRDEDLAPLGGQGALAEARWPMDHDQPPVAPARTQRVNQARTRYQGTHGRGRTVLGQRARRWRIGAPWHALRRVAGNTTDRGRVEYRRYRHVIHVCATEPLQLTQRIAELGRRGEPLAGILRHCALDNTADLVGNAVR